MTSENTEKVRERVLLLIESEYESDAAFERALGLADKTVNNWRRGRSASFMRMLPMLTEAFGVSISEVMGVPLSAENNDLSEDEIQMLRLADQLDTRLLKMIVKADQGKTRAVDVLVGDENIFG